MCGIRSTEPISGSWRDENEYTLIETCTEPSMSRTCVYLRNKSWKPDCVGSFSMDWRILVFYPEPEARDKIY